MIYLPFNISGRWALGVLLALFSVVAVSAQSVPALQERLLAAATTPEKQALNYQLAKLSAMTNPTQAALYAQQALDLSIELNNSQKEAESAWVGADLAERSGRLSMAISLYAQAKTAALKAGLPTLPLEAVVKLEMLTTKQGDYQAAYQWAQEHRLLLQEQCRLEADAQRRLHEAAQTDLAKQKNRETQIIVAALLGLAILLLFFSYSRQRAGRRMRGELAEKNAMIEEKRRRSEQLLLNILPSAVAAELTVRNKVAAQRYECATVMFIDFFGFTKVAERLSPEELIAELDFCFSAFDDLIGRQKIEKIKTVGDAYICASGLSDRNESPADIIRTALQIQEFLRKHQVRRTLENKPYFEARIGIHFGPVVAGVVGTKKFAYDIWGDTVNTAARMEEACGVGCVNVSGTARAIVETMFEWEYRGKIAAKNKGEMEMYYVRKVV